MNEVELTAARIGQVLRDKYRLERVLGVGGMGAVYAATHCRNGKRFAVKLLHGAFSAHGEARERFVREGYVANAVGHAGAVVILDDDVAEDGAPFLVMELLEGRSIQDLLDEGRPIGLAAAVEVGEQLLSVLEAAHGRGIVHRDLKPANLFVTRAGQLKILDFGIARLDEAYDGLVTQAGALLGTPSFMPPEQAMGQDVDARADLWAAGATLFVLLSGELVHQGASFSEALVNAASKPARALATVAPRVPPAIAQVVDRALAFERDARWSSALAMRDALRTARERSRIEAGPRELAQLVSDSADEDEVAASGRVVLPAPRFVWSSRLLRSAAVCSLVVAVGLGVAPAPAGETPAQRVQAEAPRAAREQSGHVLEAITITLRDARRELVSGPTYGHEIARATSRRLGSSSAPLAR